MRLGTPTAWLLAIVPLSIVAALAFATRGGHVSMQSPAATPATISSHAASRTPIAGDRRGTALLDRVDHAYAGVPAVVTQAQTAGASLTFTSILRGGVVVAESFVGTKDGARTELVAPAGSPTFARAPGASCWRALSASDPHALTDIGKRFPPVDPRGTLVSPPTRTASGWSLRLGSGAKSMTLEIDGRTAFVRDIVAAESGMRAVEHVRLLRSAPALRSPQPSC